MKSSSNIITGQYVCLHEVPASVADRIVATVIDGLVVVAYTFLMTMAYIFLEDNLHYVGLPSLFLFIVIYIPVLLYFPLCEYFFRGQSIGKALRHTRVISADGARPTIGQLLLRWMFLFVDLLMSGIGILPVLLTDRRQRFGDMAAGTMVIHEGDYKRWHASLDDFYAQTPSYHPTYPQASQLSDNQARLIERVLKADSGYDAEQTQLLAQKVATFLKVKPKTDDNIVFLSKILHDYQYFTTMP